MTGRDDRGPTHTLLEAYVLDELSAADRARVDAAAAVDPVLAETIAQIRTTVDAGRVPVPGLSPAYHRERARRLSDVFADCRERDAGPVELAAAFVGYVRDRFVRSPRFRFAVVCAGLQLAVIGFLLLRTASDPVHPKSPSRDWPTPVVDVRDPRPLEEAEDDLGDPQRGFPRRPIEVRPESPAPSDPGVSSPRFGPSFSRAALVSARFNGAIRLRTAKRWGGSDRTEAAIARGLGHLVSLQAPDGRFSFGTGRLDAVGETALGVLAFLAADIDDVRRPVIERGIAFLRARQLPSGFVGEATTAPTPRQVFGHALATQCLAEARALVPGAVDEGVAARAIGWLAPERLDDAASVTQAGIAMMVAGNLGFRVPETTEAHCRAWFAPAAREAGSSAFERIVYLAGDVLANRDRANPVSVAALAALDPGDGDVVAALYATQALRWLGDRDTWNRWNRAMVARLLGDQRDDGRFVRAGALDSTAIAVLMLQSYYRFGA